MGWTMAEGMRPRQTILAALHVTDAVAVDVAKGELAPLRRCRDSAKGHQRQSAAAVPPMPPSRGSRRAPVAVKPRWSGGPVRSSH
jgi:hypothetical protein